MFLQKTKSFRIMKRAFILVTMVMFFIQGNGQDAHFSQFYANPMYLAPSFAGSTHGFRANLNIRDQWPKVPGVFRTYSFSSDYFLSKYNSGIGLLVVSDNAGNGKMVTTKVGAAYSYKVKINKNFYFQPGLSAYYNSRTMRNDLNFSDMFTEEAGTYNGPTSEVMTDYKVQNADFAVSLLGYLEEYWFGLNVDHLMSISPVLRSDYRYTNMRVAVFGGGKYHIKRRLRSKYKEFIHVAFNYRYQSSLHQLDLGAYYNKHPFVVGLWYRGIPFGNEYITPDALIFLAGVKYLDFVFSYSYDMSIGKLISRTGGSHEISIIYILGSSGKIRPKKHRQLPCPEF